MSNDDLDPRSVADVLAGVSYPARPWQLLAQTDYYGIGGQLRAHVAHLPPRLYPNLEAVIITLATITPDPPPRQRPT